MSSGESSIRLQGCSCVRCAHGSPIEYSGIFVSHSPSWNPQPASSYLAQFLFRTADHFNLHRQVILHYMYIQQTLANPE
jgi:hypothetical protein